jgi:HSP20 family protein
MHRLIKIRIVRDLEHLQERVCRFLDPRFEANQTAGCFRPPVDFFETPQGLTLRLDLAGVGSDDFSISLAGQELVIRGQRKPPSPQGISRFLLLEIGFGVFERSFNLPVPVDPKGIEARYTDGVLTVKLPRKFPQARNIPVKSPAETD